MHRLATGQPLRLYAADWNAMCDLVEQIRKSEEDHAYNRSSIRTYVQVYNGTGAIAEEGTVWELGEPQITPSDNIDDFKAHPVFSLVKPEADTTNTLCVLTAPVNPSEQGVGVVSGAVAVKCTVSDSSDRWAKPDGNGGMETDAESGQVQLCYADSATGWCYAILGAGGGGEGHPYDGYFAVSISGEGDNRIIEVTGGMAYINGSLRNVQGKTMPFMDGTTVILECEDNSFDIRTGAPASWSKEYSCTVLAEIVEGKVRQICHCMPQLWYVGGCDEE